MEFGPGLTALSEPRIQFTKECKDTSLVVLQPIHLTSHKCLYTCSTNFLIFILNLGGYLYLPTGPSSIFKGKAKFKNRFGWSDKPFCLTFYYVMDGRSVGTLSVVVRILMGNDKRSWTVFTASGSKGRQWHFGSAFINVVNKNFEVCLSFLVWCLHSQRRPGTNL